MKMEWRFEPLRRGDVEMGITQRDDFDNDLVKLSETIVREPIQNSLDASLTRWAANSGSSIPNDHNGTVKVVFRWIKLEDKEFVKNLCKDQLPHARTAGLDVDEVDFDNPTALIIEDFGTTGLLGDIRKPDKKDFYGFWRSHGNSNKKGGSLGRWGLGKLVYSCTSEIGIFFGLTRRPNDGEQYLMGQTVLNTRDYEGKKYPPHAYFCSLEDEESNDPLPIPCEDTSFLERFCNNFELDRSDKSGLSVAIPFPNPSFNAKDMIGTSISNYFYPLLTGKLELQFDDVEINASNVRSLAKEYADHLIKDIDKLFDFIEASHEIIKSENYTKVTPAWINDRRLDQDDFDEDELKQIKTKFKDGGLVALWLPVTLEKKIGGSFETGFSVFLQKPEGMLSGQDLYVRGGLTLPGEAKFGHRLAFGAMIAEGEIISELLGYAENAAHTKWAANAAKLKKYYINAGQIITPIRNSVTQLFDLISETEGDRDARALIDYFKIKQPTDEKEKKTKKKKTREPVVVIEPKPKEFTVTKIANGFHVASSDSFDISNPSRELAVEVAYNIAKGNPFKKHSPYDFKLGEGPIKIEKVGLKEISRLPNKLSYQITNLPFKLKLTGFDVNRDLRIRVI
tara:strand:+ start:2088 stop:3956 length:1869 start_codon:yes stop_codon:yes gene_type:complete